MAGPRRRGGALAIVLLAACAAAALTAPGASPAAGTDPGCAPGFPELVLPGSAELEGLLVCSDAEGTRTLVRNHTAAVWVVESPAGVPLHVLPLAERSRSFTRLFEGTDPYIPSAAAGVFAGSAGGLRLRIDARLTVAQLTHDQLIATLARKNGPAAAALDPRPTVARRALVECLAATLGNVPGPERALSDGRLAEVLADAAQAVGSRSPCVVLWLEAKQDADLPQADRTAFASDVAGWAAGAVFSERTDAAVDAYRSLESTGGE